MKAQVSISFVAKPELRAALERAAAADEVSVSHVIRQVLRERFMPAPRTQRDQEAA